MGTCIHPEEVVGRNTAADPVVVGVAEYSFLPVLVLEGHPCCLAGPGVVVSGPASACPGS